MSDASTAVPAAIASSRTMPNDSWPSAGAQKIVRRLEPRRLLVVGDATEPLDVRACARSRRACVSGPSLATQSTASRSSPAHASSSTLESLARLVTTEEQHGGPRGRHRVRLREAVEVHAVRQHDVRAAERLLGHPARVGRDRGADRELARRAHRHLLQRAVRGVAVLARGVERSDLRRLPRRGARRSSARGPAARAGA